jgi:hypothetical protein
LQALPPNRSLHVHATDPELHGAGEWLVTHTGDAIQVAADHGKADATLSGTATNILLVLLGRKPASGPAVRVFGDYHLLDAWLEGITF